MYILVLYFYKCLIFFNIFIKVYKLCFVLFFMDIKSGNKDLIELKDLFHFYPSTGKRLMGC